MSEQHIENNMNEENVEHVESMGEQAQHALENMGEVVLEQYENAVEAVQEAHIPEKIEEAKEAVEHVMEEYHVQEKLEEVKEVVSEKLEEVKEAVQNVMEEYHVQEKIEEVSDVVAEKIVQATEFVEEKLEQAIEYVEEKKPVDEIKERAENELKGSSRPRSNSKLSGMIGMFEKKVDEINSSLTPGVNKPPVARKNSFGSSVRRPSVGEDDRVSEPSVRDASPKPSPRGEEGRPRSNSGSLSSKLAMFENKSEEQPTEGRSRSNSGVKDESPRPRSNSGKLSSMVGMFEKKVEDLNSTLTPGVNAPKPPKAEVSHVRKNSFGKKPVDEEGTEPAPKKSFKFEVKVSNLTSEKKNTDLLKSAAKEESWEKPARDETETRPRKNSLADRMKQFENQAAEEVQA
jgi:hypothetical protein